MGSIRLDMGPSAKIKASLGGSSSLRGQLLRSGAGSVVLKLTNIALGLALGIALARGLGPEGYGVYAFAFAVTTLLAIPVQLGLPTLLVREIARYHYRQDWGLMRGLLARADHVAVVVTLAVVPVAGVVAWLLLGDSETARLQLETFLWAFALVPLIALGNIRGAAIRGLGGVIQGQVPEIVMRPGLLMLFVAAAWYAELLSPVSAMALHVASGGLALLSGLYLLRGRLPAPSRGVQPGYDDAAWMRGLLPLSLMSGAKVIFDHTDIVMLGWLGTMEELGLYRVALQGSNLVAFGMLAVNMVVAPQFARLYEAGDTPKLQRLATLSARVVFTLTLPIGLGFIFFGEWILGFFFGTRFVESTTALSLLSAGQLLSTVMGSVVLLLTMSGHERYALRGQIMATGVNILLNGVLIPTYGIEGAAVATATSVVVWYALLRRSVRLCMGIESTVIGPLRS